MVYDFRLADADLDRALRTAARHGGMLQVHCEEPAIIDPLVADAVRRGETRCRFHALTRPSRAEGAATRKAIEMARRAEAPLYIVHLSAAPRHSRRSRRRRRAASRSTPRPAPTTSRSPMRSTPIPTRPRSSSASSHRRCEPRPTSTSCGPDCATGSSTSSAATTSPIGSTPRRRVPAPPFPEISNGGPGVETLLSVVYSEGVAARPAIRPAHGRGAGRDAGAPLRPRIEGCDRGGSRRGPRAVGSGCAQNAAAGGPAPHERLHAVRGDGGRPAPRCGCSAGAAEPAIGAGRFLERPSVLEPRLRRNAVP